MLRELKLASRSQNQAPHNPVIGAVFVFGDAFSDLADSLHQISLFELCEGPMSMRVVPMSIEFLGLSTNLDCVAVELMHVIQEG